MSGRRAHTLAGTPRTVLVVDDHAGFRARTRRLLERDRIRVVEAADGAHGIARAAEELPDLVLLDIHLPDMSGFDAAAAMRRADPAARILLISTHPPNEYAEQTARSAADGFVDKAELSVDVIAALLAARS